jgi:membrane-bound lytic murein transglycosylase D
MSRMQRAALRGLWVMVAVLSGCAALPAETLPAEALPRSAAQGPALPAEMQVPPAPAPEVVAAAAPAPVGPPAQRPRADAAADERGDLWDRVRSGFRVADLDSDLVHKWEQWYARDPAYVQRMTERGGRYLFHIVEELERRELPLDLALLPFIESAFNPQAHSRARASGMWQFMPATGKDFELRQNLFRDDRRDVLASTRAALDYLQRLHATFGDWHLALAAYNWGQGNVQRALDRNRRLGLPQDYASLKMPQETREYIPKLQAVKNIVSRPEAFALALPTLGNHPFFMGVPIERDIDVALAARFAGLSVDEFQQLNPQLNKPVILAAGTPQVLLPYDNANRFLHELAAYRGALASWTAWVAPRTLQPAEAARLAGASEQQLREVNLIPPRMLVKAGSALLVPRAADAAGDVNPHLADHGELALAPEPRPPQLKPHKVGPKGDSVAALARHFGVSAAQLAHWNGVTPSAHFKPGQTVVVKLPSAATGSRPSTRTGTHAGSPAGARTARHPAKPAGVRAAATSPRKTAPQARPAITQPPAAGQPKQQTRVAAS